VATAYLDNPAGRLVRILRAMKDARANLPLAQAMPEVLHVNPPLLPDVARALAELMDLPDEVQSEIEALPDDQPKELLLEWQPKVREALNCLVIQTVGPAPSISAVARIYGQEDLRALDFCSAALHQCRAELVIAPDDLARIKRLLSELLDDINSDLGLNDALRIVLLHNVREMLRACDSYERRGVESIRDAFNQTIGALWSNPDAVVAEERKASSSSKPGTVKKVIATLVTISALINYPISALTIIEAISSGQAVTEINLPSNELKCGLVLQITPAPLPESSSSRLEPGTAKHRGALPPPNA
jgi:hypothetical protein